jgi:subtilisin family serine protease
MIAATFAIPGVVSPAAARPSPPDHDSGRVFAKATEPDLATAGSDRWIVQLDDPPAASYRGGIGNLRATSPKVTGAAAFDATSKASNAYAKHLRVKQRAFTSVLASVAPGATVEHRYHVALNGMAVKMSGRQAAAVRRLAGVRAVTPDIAYHLDMFSSPAQIGAPAVWAQLGGQANAGAGVKVAVIDSGIYTPNPCFDDAGYTAPPGYPRGDTRFTNNKVIVARAYFRPDDPPKADDATALPGPGDNDHGTHVSGTIACNANTHITYSGVPLTISGVAPHAYLMNYRVFYQSNSTEDFENGNAYVAELAQAIEDAVTDGADVISNSWGASYQNPLSWPDPMVKAAEAATDAGVTMVFAASNAGPDPATISAPGNSPKVITVGAVTKNEAISAGYVDVTGPGTVPAELTNFDIGTADFGPAVTSFASTPYVDVATVATNGDNQACSLGDGSSPFPAGSLSGKIALISRGTCEFSEKVWNAQRGGAVAAIVYNSVAGGDNTQSMGAGAHAEDVTIPSWFVRRNNGLAMLTFAEANPGATADFRGVPHQAANAGDVMAGFSSRGPTTDKQLKPDVVAPGVDIVSSGYGGGTYPQNLLGFGSASGTSMATPHVAGAAALLLALHPDWTPARVKSALMSTANENVWLDTTKTERALVLDQGAGRIDLAKAAAPGLVFANPSISGGERRAGKGFDTTITATNISGKSGTWYVSTTTSSNDMKVTLGAHTLSFGKTSSRTLDVHVATVTGTDPGDYQASIVFKQKSGATLHVPVWLHVVPSTKVADVLLVDDDGSGFGAGADYGPYYKQLFDSLGVSYRYVDVDVDYFPTFDELFGYKAVVMFTGDNASFDTSGLFPSDQDALSQWLDSGGKLWAIGQNFAETSDSNVDFDSEHIGRSRLYHGYLGVREDTGDVYGGAQPPSPTADGFGPLADLHLDLSAGTGGAGNQTSIEATSPLGDTDTYNAMNTMVRFATPRDVGTASGVAWGRSSEPTLDEARVQFRYRSVQFGFGLEGLRASAGNASAKTVATRTLDWLLDRTTVSVSTRKPSPKGHGNQRVYATATSSVGAKFVRYRWDFGDGNDPVTTTTPYVDHRFGGRTTVTVEAIDALGHHAVARRTS